MVYLLRLLILGVFICTSCDNDESGPCGLTEDPDDQGKELSIVFIGNSHTHFHDLPEIVRDIASSIGDDLYVEMSAPGGYEFERHFKDPATLAVLSSRQWDYIVLQESGWRVALPPVEANIQVYPFADSLKKQIQKFNPSAELILYVTHGYEQGVLTIGEAQWCEWDPTVCNQDGMSKRIQETCKELARRFEAEPAPCGPMWQILKTKNNNLQLFEPDGVHPNINGSYANALCIYSVIRKQRLVNVYIPAEIDSETAQLLQKTVADALFDCNPPPVL
jgi:hypothetical protein